jgi:hypothetical protein
MSGEKHFGTKASVLIASALVAMILSGAASIFPSSPPQSTKKAAGLQPKQKGFATPEQAAQALVDAAVSFNVPELTQILGPGSENLVRSADPVQDRNIAAAFAAKAREKMQVSKDPKNSRRATVSVGNEDWPMPIPIVKRGGKWYFDTEAGRQEISYRRIGSNELDAITICRGFVDAQEQYALQKHDGVNQYAQRIVSTPGKQDGLVWKNADGSLGGPIAAPVARAIQQGYTKQGRPFHGYYFKVLKGQGPDAPLGAMNFIVNGVMIGGFALVAAPAEYRVTGVKTFLVGYDGIVYEKDLGPDSLAIFQKMELYNPDKTWQPTDAGW